MSETINWAALMEDSKDAFELVPEGKHNVVVTKAEAVESSTGKLMYKVQVQIASGPKTGETLFTNVVLTPDNKKAVFMFFQNLKALGITEQYLKSSPAPQPAQIAAKMIGARLVADVNHREYLGVKQNNVKSLIAGSVNGGAQPGIVPGGVRPATPAVPSVPQIPTPTPAAAQPAAQPAQEANFPVPEPQNPAPAEAAPDASAPSPAAAPPKAPF